MLHLKEATSIGTGVPSVGRTRVAWLSLVSAVLVFGLAGLTSAIHAAESKPTVSGVVNVNTASREELQLLPGVGEVRAVAIVAVRKQRGGFKQVDDLLEVSGIGGAMLDRMRPHVTLTGKTTAQRL